MGALNTALLFCMEHLNIIVFAFCFTGDCAQRRTEYIGTELSGVSNGIRNKVRILPLRYQINYLKSVYLAALPLFAIMLST